MSCRVWGLSAMLRQLEIFALDQPDLFDGERAVANQSPGDRGTRGGGRSEIKPGLRLDGMNARRKISDYEVEAVRVHRVQDQLQRLRSDAIGVQHNGTGVGVEREAPIN